MGQPFQGSFTPDAQHELFGESDAQGDFVERLRHIRRETGLDASRLRLEITENVIMQDVDFAAAMLSRLRELDVQVHIDDFGTGHSSLGALHRFPIDALKIDRLFVEMSAADKDTTSVSLRASWRSSTSWSSTSLDYSRLVKHQAHAQKSNYVRKKFCASVPTWAAGSRRCASSG